MLRKDEVLPSLEHSRLLWEEVRQKIPSPLVVGIFTIVLRLEIDGLGRMKQTTEFRGGYSITPRPEKNSLKTLTRGSIDPLVAKRLNLAPAIDLSSVSNEGFPVEMLEEKRTVILPNQEKTELKDLLEHSPDCEESLKDTWMEMKNSNVVLPEISETTYVLMRHVIDNDHLSQVAGVRVTRFFTGIVGGKGGAGEGFTAQYEISKPVAHSNDRSLPVEMLMDTIIRRVPENVPVILSPQAMLTLFYNLRLYSPQLLKRSLLDHEKVIASPSSRNACFGLRLDDRGESFLKDIKIVNPLPHIRAKDFGNPLHDSSYDLKETPIHMQFQISDVVDSPSQVILVNDIAPITTVFGASRTPILTGLRCILIQEGELVAQVPFLNFATPSMQSLLTGMNPTTKNFWTSPSILPVSGEFPYALLSKTKILPPF